MNNGRTRTTATAPRGKASLAWLIGRNERTMGSMRGEPKPAGAPVHSYFLRLSRYLGSYETSFVLNNETNCCCIAMTSLMIISPMTLEASQSQCQGLQSLNLYVRTCTHSQARLVNPWQGNMFFVEDGSSSLRSSSIALMSGQ